MANGLYTAGKQGFLTGAINWVSDTITLVAVDSQEYTPNLTTNSTLADVPAGGRIASANLANKTATAGVADADDVTLTGVTGDQFEYLVLYKNTGTENTSTLIALIDTATGLPVTPSGQDVVVVWSNGSSKIFQL